MDGSWRECHLRNVIKRAMKPGGESPTMGPISLCGPTTTAPNCSGYSERAAGGFKIS